MRFLVLSLMLLLVLSTDLLAVHVAVLETVADDRARDFANLSDRQYMTNVLREVAVKQLPAEENFTIMTRENIVEMLPPGKSIEDCEGTCLTETGRNIAADYVCQARVGRFGSSLTLSAELYETAGSKLVASFNGRGSNVEELLNVIKQKAPSFFRSVRGKTSGIGDVVGAGEFSFEGVKKVVVNLVSVPAGAIPTVDGKAIPKCTKTPCKIAVEEGTHRIVMSMDRYDDAEMFVDISESNQKVELKLSPNFGWLIVDPILRGPAGRDMLSVKIDGRTEKGKKFALDPGTHSVYLTHPCYDPVQFSVTIARNKTETFDAVMQRGKGGLELNAEYRGEPQAVAVYIDGEESGRTPYSGEIPLCADVVLRGDGWSETVKVTPRWHEVVRYTHHLSHNPLLNSASRQESYVSDDADHRNGSRFSNKVASNKDDDNYYGWGFLISAGYEYTKILEQSGLEDRYIEVYDDNQDSLNWVVIPIALKFKYYGRDGLNFGFGGGLAFSWLNLGYVDEDGESDIENLDVFVSPLVTAEIGIGRVWEFGIRETALLNTMGTTLRTGAFVTAGDLVGVEIGWSYTNEMASGVYFSLYGSIPNRFIFEDIARRKREGRW
ncbi:PEGA domain-containing protein [Fibrobacter sp.]|uniref:PEGA domain-containing protein n=1 Tax=Fibrobacter sp. TaxID=35828 RepID=UPI00388FAF85